jgi:nitrite reductase (NADH) small subunit
MTVIEIEDSEILEGQAHAVRVGRREILLVRWRGELLAVRNICPHMSCPLTTGRVAPNPVSDEVGQIDVDLNWPTIQCPWHNYVYDLRTGRCLSDPNLRIKTYKVEAENGFVSID